MLNWKCIPLTREDFNEISIMLYIETKMEMSGYDGNGRCCYIGTGCFHRRETLSGQKYRKNFKENWKRLSNGSVEERTSVLEEKCKVLASSSYEKNSQWGKEVCVCVCVFNSFKPPICLFMMCVYVYNSFEPPIHLFADGFEVWLCSGRFINGISHAMSRLEIHIFQSEKEGLSRSCSHNTTTVTCTT